MPDAIQPPGHPFFYHFAYLQEDYSFLRPCSRLPTVLPHTRVCSRLSAKLPATSTQARSCVIATLCPTNERRILPPSMLPSSLGFFLLAFLRPLLPRVQRFRIEHEQYRTRCIEFRLLALPCSIFLDSLRCLPSGLSVFSCLVARPPAYSAKWQIFRRWSFGSVDWMVRPARLNDLIRNFWINRSAPATLLLLFDSKPIRYSFPSSLSVCTRNPDSLLSRELARSIPWKRACQSSLRSSCSPIRVSTDSVSVFRFLAIVLPGCYNP